ncbi:MAG TPA: hypothetical protein VHQ99_02160 [Gaiellaceae bacterium]|jgi:hypothetical protein|nr:hypothetical protein [Gaiellaceae bacterium]
MGVEITPEPNEGERKAILAALAAEVEEQRRASDWAAALQRVRNQEEREP